MCHGISFTVIRERYWHVPRHVDIEYSIIICLVYGRNYIYYTAGKRWKLCGEGRRGQHVFPVIVVSYYSTYISVSVSDLFWHGGYLSCMQYLRDLPEKVASFDPFILFPYNSISKALILP